MQHLSRRFSGYSYLYVVIASAVWLIGSNLAITFEKSAYFFGEHSTLIHLLFMLLIFIPPLVAVALKRYPFREALRIRAFTAAQLLFALAVGICMYFALSAVTALLDKLSTALLYPDFADLSDGYFASGGFPVWPYLLTACLIPAVLEGAVYQGVMLSGLHQTRPIKACLTVGLLYALAQFSLAAFIPNTLLGFTLCYIALRSGSVIPAVSAGFVYLLMSRFTVAFWLNHTVFVPFGLGGNAAAIILAVVFTLLGGWLLVKMPDRKYEKGAFGRALRNAFPGLFTLGLTPLEDESENGTAHVKSSETPPDAEQPAFDTVLAEAAAPEEPPAETAANPRDDNPLIAGIFVSGTITLVMLGITILSALGYFGG